MSKFVLAAVALAAAVTACGNVEVHEKGASMKGVQFVSRDSTRTLGPGDVRIASQDSAIELAIIGDSIVAGFGTRVREKIARKTDTTKVRGDGFAAGIEKFVKGTVASALNHDMQFPVTEVSDVRYEDGTLRFYDTNGRRMHFFEGNEHSADADRTRFRQQDADAFIAAFKARKNFKA